MLIGLHLQIKFFKLYSFTENIDKRDFGYDEIFEKITTHGRSYLSILRESYQKSDLKRKYCLLSCFTFLSQPASVLLSNSYFFIFHPCRIFFIFHLCQIFFIFHLCQILSSCFIKSYKESCLFDQTSLSSLLRPSIDLELSNSASLYIYVLRISATYCVNWTNRLFGKASPINGFGVSLPTNLAQ